MIIPINFRYKYKEYPFSQKATTRSKQLGILTCGAMCMVYALFWYGFVFLILSATGSISESACFAIAAISIVGFVFVINHIKKKAAAKIDKMALEELQALQHTDPRSFAAYAGMFKGGDAQKPPIAQNPVHANGINYAQYQNRPQQPNSVSYTPPVQPSTPKVQPTSETNTGAQTKSFCIHCGTALKPGSASCHNCGKKA